MVRRCVRFVAFAHAAERDVPGAAEQLPSAWNVPPRCFMEVDAMRIVTQAAVVLLTVIGLTACGGDSRGSSGSPSSPSTPTPPANRAPVISSANVNPAWGVSTLTTHSFTGSATDPDGDAISYEWDFGNGASNSSSSASVTYNNANTATYQAVLTATDSKGSSTTSTVSVVSTTMTGTWAGVMVGDPITVVMTQSLGGLVTGTWEQPTRSGHGDVGPSGEPGKIQANGQFELRFKVRVGSYVDFYYRGTMDPTGQLLTGTLQGSGFSGQYMSLRKH